GISGLDGTTGSYTLQFILNAALDDGSHGTQATAQDLGPAFVSGRAALLGSVNRDQHWFSVSLAAGQSSTFALNGPAHVALVNSTGTILATGRAGPNGSEIISDFIAPGAGTFYALVGGTGSGQYTLLVTRNATLDSDPNTSFDTAQELVASATGAQQYVFGNVGNTGISSPHVLYFTDGGPITPDPYLDALTSLGITPTVVAGSTGDPTAPYAAFVTQLQVGGWDLVIFQQRFWASGDFPSFSWT